MEIIFRDGEKILGEIDEVAEKEDQAVSQRVEFAQVEGLQVQHLLYIHSLYYQGSPKNWRASIFRQPSKQKIPSLKVRSIRIH